MAESPPRKTLRPLCGKIGRERVEMVVTDFYQRLHKDPMLAPFFANIKDPFAHQHHVADFWWVAMGGRVETHQPFDMVGRHLPLNLRAEHLDRWLHLFGETLDARLPQELAAPWHQMAIAIGNNLRRTVVNTAPGP